jgi:tetratricopeptide (TPR) repeat protein
MALKIKHRHKSKPTGPASSPLVQAKLNEAIALHQQGRFEQAITLYSDILKVEPRHFDAIHLLGVIADHMKNHRLAVDLIDQAIAINSSNADAYFNRGNALKELNQLDAAVESYDKAVRLNPRYANAFNNRGVVLQKLSRFAAAAESYGKAVRIKPDYAEAHFNLGVVLQELQRFDEALASYNRVTALKPDFPAAHYNSGIALHGLERFDEALASYDRAIALDPNYAEAHANRGVTLEKLKRFDESVAGYDAAIALKPEYAEAYFNRANALTELGRLEAAVESYEQAIGTKPDFAEAYLSLGHRRYELDDRDRTIAAYKKAWTADSANFGLDGAVHLAILDYLNDDHEQCRSKLSASRPILAIADPDRETVRAFWYYLDILLDWWGSNRDTEQSSDVGTLHVIGESHALSTHRVTVDFGGRTVRCVAEWISGCKQWHLGKAGPNKYKHQFEAIMARLPLEAAVLVVIGEIDCRHNEGIIKAWQKTPERSLDDVVTSTVEPYIRYIAEVAARHGHRPIITGVPAINIKLDALSQDEIAQFSHLIRTFNAILKKQALAAGMGFLDVFALTDRGDGIAKGDWHIDTYHLLPTATAEAFRKHYSTP